MACPPHHPIKVDDDIVCQDCGEVIELPPEMRLEAAAGERALERRLDAIEAKHDPGPEPFDSGDLFPGS